MQLTPFKMLVSPVPIARQLAVQWHGPQMYGDQPYVVHLDEVVAILTEYEHTDEPTLMGGYLHDVLEDHPEVGAPGLSKAGIPTKVIQAVQFCTDEPGHNRKTRKANTYQRVRNTLDALSFDPPGGYLLMGLRVKLADRLANLRSTIRQGSSLLQMYQKETRAFRDAYYISGVCNPMWTEYDRLLGLLP